MRLKNKFYADKLKLRGQSTLEYAVITIVIVAALIGMQGYIKRALSGGLRTKADEIGPQYDPKNTTGSITITNTDEIDTDVESEDKIHTDGTTYTQTTTTVTITKDKETRSGSETVGALGSDLF